MLMQLIDFLKSREITVFFTKLLRSEIQEDDTETGVSSLIDTWIHVRDIKASGERNRGIYVIKSRGMEHSNQIRDFLLTDRGVQLLDVYLGPEGVLTGAARLTQKAREKAELTTLHQEIERRKRNIERRRQVREAQIAALRAESEVEEEELMKVIEQEEALRRNRERMALLRRADIDQEVQIAGEQSGKREK